MNAQRVSVLNSNAMLCSSYIYFIYNRQRRGCILYCKLVTEYSYTDYNLTSHTPVFNIDALHIVNHSPPLMT